MRWACCNPCLWLRSSWDIGKARRLNKAQLNSNRSLQHMGSRNHLSVGFHIIERLLHCRALFTHERQPADIPLSHYRAAAILGAFRRGEMYPAPTANATHSVNLVQRLATNIADFFHGYSIPQFVTFKLPDIMLRTAWSTTGRWGRKHLHPEFYASYCLCSFTLCVGNALTASQILLTRIAPIT